MVKGFASLMISLERHRDALDQPLDGEDPAVRAADMLHPLKNCATLCNRAFCVTAAVWRWNSIDGTEF